MINSNIQVILRQSKGVIFHGKVEAVSAINQLGQFDILANHANFVTTIKDLVILTHSHGYRREFKLETGILSVRNNQVEVFFGI